MCFSRSCRLYYARKKSFDTATKSLYMSHPSLLVYVKSMLRVDPCFKVIAPKISTDADVEAAKKTIGAAFKAANLPADDAKLAKFIADFNADVDELHRKFPTRVTV